ncbi:MAG: ASKHA domain-containing protein [Pseudomonadota bacterium]
MTSDRKPFVVFTPSGKRGHVEVGTSVLAAARQLGVDLDSVCGGRGICSKCQVQPGLGAFPKHGIDVTADALSPFNAVEARYDEKRGLAPGRRLGCQALIQGDTLVDVPPESQVHKQVVRKRAEARDITVDPVTRLYYVEVAEPDMHHPSGDLERLLAALRQQWDLARIQADLPILQKLQPILRKGNWRVTCAVAQSAADGPAQILDIWPGYHDGPVLGLAVDLGSTTIAAHLVDLASGAVLGSGGRMNPQIRFGEDLMSRVSHAMLTEGGAAEMTAAVQAAMDEMAGEIAQEAGHAREEIFEVVLVANPVMHHLYLGLDPVELGQAPFALTSADALTLKAADLGLHLHPAAALHTLPCIAGHVGADAAAVALSEAPDRSDDLVLIVDVGTNAEILLGDKTGVLACSSPTGPAFEGAQISAGQRAAPGAIERVEIDPVTKQPRVRVIGCPLWSDAPGFAEAIAATGVTGICGSGIIEAVAEMRSAGLVDAGGLVGGPDRTGTARCIADGRTFAFVLYEDASQRILVTQGDIRAIQLAKSALYAGARLLMDQMKVDQVDRVVLAGAFGAHISPKHALILGMIPDCDVDRVTSAGNAAGTGARIALLNRAARAEIAQTVRRIQKVETAVEPRFQEHFVAANHIPHATAPFAALRRAVPLPEPQFGARAEAQNRRRRARARTR